MKKLTTTSLFIFGVICVSVLTSGLVFYQNNKNQKEDNKISELNVSNSSISNQNLNEKTITKTGVAGSNTSIKTSTDQVAKTLDMTEIAKHNSSSDCWIIVNGKIYDITSYFGKHPGGNGTMSATCGKDATDAYMTQDPYATSSGSRSAHSSRAKNLLNEYYIGDLK